MPSGVSKNQQQGQKLAVHIVRDITWTLGQLSARARRSLRAGAAMSMHTARAVGRTGAFRAAGAAEAFRAAGAAIVPERAVMPKPAFRLRRTSRPGVTLRAAATLGGRLLRQLIGAGKALAAFTAGR